MPESPIRKLAPYANQAKARGVSIFHLNIGQPDIASPAAALDVLKTLETKVLEYSPSEGLLSYREQLARYYQNLGFQDITADDIIVTTGGSEALSFVISALCDAGDQVIIQEPYYANYNGFSKALGVEVVAVTSSIDHDFALPSIRDFEKAITPQTKAIILCNPGNPTGYVYSLEELKALAKLALKHNLAIIADEVYREYVYQGKHHSILALEELSSHAIVIDSESKRYSLCGVRTGFLVTRNKTLRATILKFAQARLSPPLLGQLISQAAHQNDEAYITSVREEYAQRRDVLIQELAKIEGLKCSKPKGAFYCICALPVEDAEDFSLWLLRDFHHENKTLMLAPASGFYADSAQGKNQVRIAYVLKKEDLVQAVALLKKALEVYRTIKK